MSQNEKWCAAVEKLTKSHLCVAQLSQIFYAFTLVVCNLPCFLFICKIQHFVE